MREKVNVSLGFIPKSWSHRVRNRFVFYWFKFFRVYLKHTSLNSISNIKSGDNDRKNALREFTLTFVPLDVNEDDSNAYADSLFAN